MTMVLRSLVVKLKAFPRRMPGFGAFVSKGNPRSKSSAKLTYPTKLGYVDEILSKKDPLLHQRIMHGRERSRKTMRAYDRITVLIGIVGLGYVGRIASVAADYNQGGEQQKLV